MKYRFLNTLLCLLPMTAYSSCEGSDGQEVIVESKTYFKPWNSKNSGSLVDTQLIKVCISENTLQGFQIERLEKSGVTVEKYKPNESGSVDLWVYLTEDREKLLTKQATGLFMIIETVPGASGGQRIEHFRLN